MKPGDKAGRYQLGEQIGEGAMAQVFASCHPVFERPVAIKILKKEACYDAHFVARFLDDARAAHGLDHPNIVRVLDVDDSGDQPFIVMELVDGLSLDRWLAGRRLEVPEAVRIARDVARALAVAHAAGVVHRDVKPSNILIDNKTGTAKLTDFGAAKRERPGGQLLTEIGQRIGTPRYMAPEQIEGGPVDARTDLFALGATLYELLAGKPAFEGSTVSAVFHGILFGQPQSLAEQRPDAPPELVRLVERLHAKSPDDRPASAEGEVAAVLSALLDEAETPVKPQPAVAASGYNIGNDAANRTLGGTMDRSRLVPLIAGAVLLLVVIGGGAWLYSISKPEQGQPPEPELEEVATATPPEPEAQPEEAVPPEAAPSAADGDQAASPPPSPAADESTAATTAELTSGAGEAPTSTPSPPAGSGSESTAAVEPAATGPATAAPAAAALDCPAGPEAAPGCALAAQALRALGTPAAAAPRVAMNRPDGIYLDQDYLVAEVELPPSLGGYLYLDVLTDAGTVYHLLPEPLRQDNELPAGGEIRIGVEEGEGQDGVRHWQVGEPFGDGYLLVLVSQNPLYQGLRPAEEPITEYREVLLKALADPGTGRKAAQLERIEFRPRG